MQPTMRAGRARPTWADPLPRGALRRGGGALRAGADARPGQPGRGPTSSPRPRPTPPPRSTCSCPSCASSTPTTLLAPPPEPRPAQPAEPARRPALAPTPLLGRATPSGTSAAWCSRPSSRASVGDYPAGCGRTGTARALYRGDPHARVHAREARPAQPQVDLPRRTPTSAFAPAGLTPPEGVTHFRTADGSWNNLDNPKEGAAGTRFPRNVANSADPASDRRGAADPQPAPDQPQAADPRRAR